MSNKTKVHVVKWGGEMQSVHLKKHDAHKDIAERNYYSSSSKMKEIEGGYEVEMYHLEPINA